MMEHLTNRQVALTKRKVALGEPHLEVLEQFSSLGRFLLLSHAGPDIRVHNISTLHSLHKPQCPASLIAKHLSHM